jgi:hypothetical protein
LIYIFIESIEQLVSYLNSMLSTISSQSSQLAKKALVWFIIETGAVSAAVWPPLFLILKSVPASISAFATLKFDAAIA